MLQLIVAEDMPVQEDTVAVSSVVCGAGDVVGVCGKLVVGLARGH